MSNSSDPDKKQACSCGGQGKASQYLIVLPVGHAHCRTHMHSSSTLKGYSPRAAWHVVVQGVQLNAVDGAGNTALLDAIRHSHKEVQAALRAAGANLAAVNVADKLCLAAAENDTAILEVWPLCPGCLPVMPALLYLDFHDVRKTGSQDGSNYPAN